MPSRAITRWQGYPSARSLFLYLKNQKADFYCLQETFSLEEDEVIWASEWGEKILFSHGTKHSNGTGILLIQTVDLLSQRSS